MFRLRAAGSGKINRGFWTGPYQMFGLYDAGEPYPNVGNELS